MILRKEPATACTGWLKRENVAKQPFLGLRALGMKNQQEKSHAKLHSIGKLRAWTRYLSHVNARFTGPCLK